MPTSTKNLDVLKQLYSCLSPKEQDLFLTSLSKKEITDTVTKQRKVSNCPHCQSKHCGINLDGLSVAKVASLGKPKLRDLEKVLNGKIAEDSVFVTDSFRAYSKLSADMRLNHIRISRNKRTSGIFNIQTINNYHSRFKDLIIGRFKGVASKYLNNYLVYHNFVNFAKESKDEKEGILFDFIRNVFCDVRVRNISKRKAVPVL